MTKKASAATIDQRIELIYRLILDGWESVAIVQNKTVRDFNVKERQIRRYIQRARDRMDKELEQYRVGALSEHIAARRKLRRDAKRAKDKLDILKDEAKLLGLYAPDKLQQLNLDLGSLTTEQLERIAQGEDPINVLATTRTG